MLENEQEIETLLSLQAETTLSPESFLAHFAAIRSAIYTKCFLEELEETGLIFKQINRALKDLDPAAWDKLKGTLACLAG